jgi:ribosomal protein S26
MKKTLKKIYPYSAKQAVNEILKTYEKNGFVVSNFIYFAIIKVQKLFESTKKTTRQKEYKKAIMK